MDDLGTIFNVLKNLKDDYSSVVRYCNTNRKIKKYCIQYAEQIFGIKYGDIIYSLAINKEFPSLHYHLSLEQLYEYYKSFPEIWKQLHINDRIREIPMCREFEFDFKDDEGTDINPTDPKNLKYIAPYHKAILYPHKKITFLFFRHLDKIPTNIFDLERDEILTPYHFIEMGTIENLEQIVKNITEEFINNPKNKSIWERYIKDPMWKQENI